MLDETPADLDSARTTRSGRVFAAEPPEKAFSELRDSPDPNTESMDEDDTDDTEQPSSE